MKDAIYVLCYPNSKHPKGTDWASHPLTARQVAESFANNPAQNVGILLGPASGILDVEIDSEEAAKAFQELFGDTRTPCWQSARGEHFLFQYDERLAELPGVTKHNGVEYRLGNGRATQSIYPPSVVDGVKREWIVRPEDCKLAPLPEHVIELLLALPKAKKGGSRSYTHAEIPGARNATVKRLLRYCERVGIRAKGTRNRGDHTFIDVHCPFKHPANEKGDPAFVVNDDGSWAFHCFHAGCSKKTRADIEKEFGPLIPTIRITPDLYEVVAKSIQALCDHPNVFQRGGVLMGLAYDAPRPKLCLHDNHGSQLRPYSTASLRVTASSVARYEKFDSRKGKWVHSLPTDPVVNGILANPEYPGIPVITGVVSCPVLRSDGSIAAEPGYDPLTGLYLDIDGCYPPLMQPSEAVALLADVLYNFPFAAPAHRSGWFAGLITLVARAAFAGCSPFFLYDANTSRVGKGLLTDVQAAIIEGRRAARHSFAKDDDELRKLITTVALSGVSHLLFDNIKGKFGGPTMENVLTTGRWADRLLGINRHVSLSLNFVCLGTSNNAVLSKDMIGRTCHIRLETDHERPELRTGFKHPDLLGYVQQRRRELAIATLSIPAAYIKAKSPDQHLPAWGGYENWSDLVRGSLVWAGLPDPDTRQTLAEQADDETAILRQLMAGWEELGGVATVAEAIKKVDADEAPTLKMLVATLSGERNRALGTLLRDYRGRVLNGRKFERTNTDTPRWQLVTADIQRESCNQ